MLRPAATTVDRRALESALDADPHRSRRARSATPWSVELERRRAARRRAAPRRSRGARPLLRVRRRRRRRSWRRRRRAARADRAAHGRREPRRDVPGSRAATRAHVADPAARGGGGGRRAHQLRARPRRHLPPRAARDPRRRSPRAVVRPRAAPRAPGGARRRPSRWRRRRRGHRGRRPRAARSTAPGSSGSTSSVRPARSRRSARPTCSPAACRADGSPAASRWSGSRRRASTRCRRRSPPSCPASSSQATVLDNVLHGTRAPPAVVARAGRGGGRCCCSGCVVGPALRRLPGGWGTIAARWCSRLATWSRRSACSRAAGLALGGVYPLGALVLCDARRRRLPVGRRGAREAEDPRRLPALREPRDHRPASRASPRGCGWAASGARSRCSSPTSAASPGLAEQLPPETLGELLNQYLGAMTDVVFAHDGLLDKYIGDAVMAFWGAPVRCAGPRRALLPRRARHAGRARAAEPALGRPPGCRGSRSGSASTPATRSSATSARRAASATRRWATT